MLDVFSAQVLRTLRSILLILLVVAMNGTPIIENPGSSLIWLHDRFQWLLEILENAGLREPQLKLLLQIKGATTL